MAGHGVAGRAAQLDSNAAVSIVYAFENSDVN